MKVLIFCLLLNLTSCINAQSEKTLVKGDSQTSAQKEGSKTNEVSFCEMMQSPEQFGKEPVKVKAVYRYGFEWSEFYSLKCEPKKRIWVERAETECENAGQIEKFEPAAMGGRTYGVVAVGTLIEKKDGYGYMNNYNYLFMVKCFEKSVLLDREGYLPHALDSEQHRRIEEFERGN